MQSRPCTLNFCCKGRDIIKLPDQGISRKVLLSVCFCNIKMSQRGAPGAPKVKRVMTQAINLIFEFLKNVRVIIAILPQAMLRLL
jgi:hypothetical protein